MAIRIMRALREKRRPVRRHRVIAPLRHDSSGSLAAPALMASPFASPMHEKASANGHYFNLQGKLRDNQITYDSANVRVLETNKARRNQSIYVYMLGKVYSRSDRLRRSLLLLLRVLVDCACSEKKETLLRRSLYSQW